MHSVEEKINGIQKKRVSISKKEKKRTRRKRKKESRLLFKIDLVLPLLQSWNSSLGKSFPDRKTIHLPHFFLFPFFCNRTTYLQVFFLSFHFFPPVRVCFFEFSQNNPFFFLFTIPIASHFSEFGFLPSQPTGNSRINKAFQGNVEFFMKLLT